MIPKDVLITLATEQYSISENELEVLIRAIEGQSTDAIARELDIKPDAVRKRLGEVYKKFAISGTGPGKLAKLQQKLVAYYQKEQAIVTTHSVLEKSHPATELYLDWGEAIDVSAFFGREEELTKLTRWVTEDRCRLVAILGMGGIGKTALSIRMAQLIADQQQSSGFEVIIWRSLRNAPILSDLLTNLFTTLPQGVAFKADVSGLIDYFRQHRCLLILDNIETILKSGDRVGYYQEPYKNYGELFQKVGEISHHSCLVLTSREKPKEVAPLEGRELPIRSLVLSGLKEKEAQEILRAKGLSGNEEQWNQLIQSYGGNPLALKIVSTAIYELFGQNISEFLTQIRQGTTIFGEIRDLLDQQFNRLSELEKEVMYWLAINQESSSLTKLREDMVANPSPVDLMEGLESLSRRSLIEKIDHHQSGFTQQSVVMEYVIEQLVEQMGQEIQTQSPDLLDRHALLKAQSKDYIRDTQHRLIRKPILDQLVLSLGGSQGVEQTLKHLLDKLRREMPLKPGYASGNLLNLLVALGVDLTGYDFSQLAVWQAYLQGITLQRVNFSQSDLQRSVFTETFGSIMAIAFSADDRLLATGDGNGDVRLWQVEDGEQLQTLTGHGGWVRSLVFSPDGNTLLSGSDDETIRCWDVKTGNCSTILEGHSSGVRAIALSPDGRILVSGSSDQTVKLWDWQAGTCLQTIAAHDDWVRSVAFSPDGRTLISGSSDKTAKLWEVATGKRLRTLTGHDRSLRSVAFSPHRPLLATGSSDQLIKLWDTRTGECVRSLRGHESRVWCVTFHPTDDTILASSSDDQTVKIWDITTGNCLQTLEGHSSRVWCVAFNPRADQDEVASGSDDQTVKLWDWRTGQCKETLQGYVRSLRSIAFSPDGQTLASGGDDPLVRLWDVPTERCQRELQGHRGRVWAVAFHPHDRTLLASGSDDQTVRLWNLASLDKDPCTQVLQGHINWVRAIAFSPDGQRLASGSDDQTIRLWNLKSGKCVRILKGHTDWVWSVVFSPNGQLLASGSNDQTVRLWQMSDGATVNVLQGHTGWVRAVAFSPDNAILASGGKDQTVRLWEVDTGKCLRVMSGHNSRVRSLAFSQDGALLAFGREDRLVQLWDVQTGLWVKDLEGHADWVRSVAFSPDGKTLASAGKDAAILRWDVSSGDRIGTLMIPKPYAGMDITDAIGITELQRSTLLALGAIDRHSAATFQFDSGYL